MRATGKLRRVCAFEQSRQNLCYPHSIEVIHSLDTQWIDCMCEQRKLRRVCAFISSLARAFATPIQNISAFEDKDTPSTVVFMAVFIACASNESSESAHYSSLVRASSTSVNLGDVDSQLFIAFSNNESTGFHWNKQTDPPPSPGKSWIYPE